MLNRLLDKKKWIILGIIVLSLTTYNIYTRSYFRFENFKSADQLIDYLNNNFPPGSDPEKAKFLLKEAGAKCREFGKSFHYGEPRNTEKEWSCEYLHWELSLDLRIRFTVSVYIDKQNTLIRFSAGRYPEIV